MLKLCSKLEVLPEKVEIDDYLPLVIMWGTSNEIEPKDYLEVEPKLYWSLASKETLLEVGMDTTSQCIQIVKLVLTGKYCESESGINSDIPSQTGLPTFDISDWDKSHYLTDYSFRDEGSFDLHVGKTKICIFLSKNEAKHQVISGRTRFGFDEHNFLCALEVDDLLAEEMEKLVGTLEYQRISST
jgi:hypothetical protein